MKTSSPEFGQMQRERIMKTRPWEKSTGARTEAGKERSKMNALKMDYEIYILIKQYSLLMEQQKEINKISFN